MNLTVDDMSGFQTQEMQKCKKGKRGDSSVPVSVEK